jgi:hypothetical protein
MRLKYGTSVWSDQNITSHVIRRRQLAPFFERISYGLGQRYHYLDEISILFETTRKHFRPRYVVLAIAELSRTISRFHQHNDDVVQTMRTFQTIRQNCEP